MTSTGPAIAKLEGSGYGKADGELPIDINYQKLTEWLVSRKKMASDWHKRVQAIQAKITEASKTLPPGLLAGLSGGADAPIDYFRAAAIRDALAQDGERTLFGGLAGAAGVWDAIVKAYEKQNVYMGEAASTMVANVDYELPYIRKQGTRYAQLMADGERKAAEYTKSAATAAANFKQECERLGIAGADVRKELTRLGARLPAAYQELLPDLRNDVLGEAVAYYAAFVEAAHTRGSGGSEQPQQSQGEDAAGAGVVLPILSEVREGRTAPPAASSACSAAAGAAGGAPVEIDWDSALSGGVDLGPDMMGANAGAAATGGGTADIDWDLDLSDLAVTTAGDDTSGDAVAVPGDADAGPAISWDIELTAADVAAADSDAEKAAAEGKGAVDESAAGADAEQQVETAAARLAADPSYRTALTDDLAELRAFLSQRCSELTASGSSDTGGGAELLSALLPPAVAAVDATGAARLLAAVDAAAAALAAPKLRQLALIAGSARYADRLARELGRRAGQEAKLLAAGRETEARRHESRAAMAALAPRSAALAERTRVAQRAVESALSSQLGRRVLILGEINNALATAEATAKGQA